MSENVIKPVYYLPEKLFPNEEWREITDKLIPGIQPYYIVSNYGRVYNWKDERMIAPIESSNHFTSHLRSVDKDGNSIDNTKATQRIMMSEFHPIDNIQNYETDHIDGCSFNNMLDNLQWLTREENIKKELNSTNSRHSLKQVRGENHYFSKLTDSQVREICRLLSDTNMSYPEIARSVGINASNIPNIKNRKNWIHISKDYVWPHRI